MSDIFKEVDEALKQEKVEEFWSKHGSLVIFLIILIIAGTGTYSVYNGWLQADREKKTEVIMDLYKNPDTFDEAKLAPLDASQKVLAEMFIARQHLEKEEYPEAFAAYEKVRQNTSAEVNLRGLAAYYARNMIINGQMEGNLADIKMDKPTIWDEYLRLQTALDLGSRQEKYDDAIIMLNDILDGAAPDNTTLRQQVEQLKYVYEYDQKEGN